MKVMRAYIFAIFATAMLYSCLPDPLGVFTDSTTETIDDEPSESVSEENVDPFTGTTDSGSDAVDDDEPKFDPEASIIASADFVMPGAITPTGENDSITTFGWSDIDFRCMESTESEKAPGYVRVFVTAHASDDAAAQFLSTENVFAVPCSGKIRFSHDSLMEGLKYSVKVEILPPAKDSVLKTFAGSFSVPDPATTNNIEFELAEQT